MRNWLLMFDGISTPTLYTATATTTSKEEYWFLRYCNGGQLKWRTAYISFVLYYIIRFMIVYTFVISSLNFFLSNGSQILKIKFMIYHNLHIMNISFIHKTPFCRNFSFWFSFCMFGHRYDAFSWFT